MLDQRKINNKMQMHRLKLRKGYQNLARVGKKIEKMVLGDCYQFIKLTLTKWSTEYQVIKPSLSTDCKGH